MAAGSAHSSITGKILRHVLRIYFSRKALHGFQGSGHRILTGM